MDQEPKNTPQWNQSEKIINEDNRLKEENKNRMISIPMKIIRRESNNAETYDIIPERIKVVSNTIEEQKGSIENLFPLTIRRKKMASYILKGAIEEDKLAIDDFSQIKEKNTQRSNIEKTDIFIKRRLSQDKENFSLSKMRYNNLYSFNNRSDIGTSTKNITTDNSYNYNHQIEKNDKRIVETQKQNSNLNNAIETNNNHRLPARLKATIRYKKKSKPNSVMIFNKKTVLDIMYNNTETQQENDIEIISILSQQETKNNREIDENVNYCSINNKEYDDQSDLIIDGSTKEKENKTLTKTRNTPCNHYESINNINVKHNYKSKTNSINHLHSFEIIQEEKEDDHSSIFNHHSEIDEVRKTPYDSKHVYSLQINGLPKPKHAQSSIYSDLQIDNTTNKMILSQEENINSKINKAKNSFMKPRRSLKQSTLKCAHSNSFSINLDNYSPISRDSSFNYNPFNNYFSITNDHSFINTDQSRSNESKRINDSYSNSQYQYDHFDKKHNIQLIFERNKNKQQNQFNSSKGTMSIPEYSGLRLIESHLKYANYRYYRRDTISNLNSVNDNIEQNTLCINTYCNNINSNSSIKHNRGIVPLHLSIIEIPSNNNPLINRRKEQLEYMKTDNSLLYKYSNTPANKIKLLNNMIHNHQQNKKNSTYSQS